MQRVTRIGRTSDPGYKFQSSLFFCRDMACSSPDGWADMGRIAQPVSCRHLCRLG